jgi:hypothetical protein
MYVCSLGIWSGRPCYKPWQVNLRRFGLVYCIYLFITSCTYMQVNRVDIGRATKTQDIDVRMFLAIYIAGHAAQLALLSSYLTKNDTTNEAWYHEIHVLCSFRWQPSIPWSIREWMHACTYVPSLTIRRLLDSMILDWPCSSLKKVFKNLCVRQLHSNASASSKVKRSIDIHTVHTLACPSFPPPIAS